MEDLLLAKMPVDEQPPPRRITSQEQSLGTGLSFVHPEAVLAMPCAPVVPDTAQRVLNCHHNPLRAQAKIKLFSQIHVFLKPGESLTGEVNGQFYSRIWQLARADSFELHSELAARG